MQDFGLSIEGLAAVGWPSEMAIDVSFVMAGLVPRLPKSRLNPFGRPRKASGLERTALRWTQIGAIRS
jgi:hypothetical protein